MKPFSQPWAPISQSPVEKKYVVHWQTLQSCSSVIHAMTIYAKHSFLSDASYAHAECGSCKITESWKLQSVVSPPLKNVCAHLHLKLSAYHITAFFNHFAAAEPSAKCLRCSWNPMQWSKCRYCYNRIELWLWISSQAISVCFGGTSGSHSRNPEVEKRWRINSIESRTKWR